MMQIRQVFIDYLIGIGFTEDQIKEAWELSQTTIYTDFCTLEIMTRDLLRTPEQTKKWMQPYLKNK